MQEALGGLLGDANELTQVQGVKYVGHAAVIVAECAVCAAGIVLVHLCVLEGWGRTRKHLLVKVQMYEEPFLRYPCAQSLQRH